MDNNKEYFIYLLNCYVNNTVPQGRDDIFFEKIYEFSKINGVAAIIKTVTDKLDEKYKVKSPYDSYFNQNLGYTVQSYSIKCEIIETIKSIFTKNNIRYLFIKGSVTKEKYPNPELRTGGDIDVVVDKENYIFANELLIQNGFFIDHQNEFVTNLSKSNENVELHCILDAMDNYFINPFDFCTNDGLSYRLTDYNELLYTLCHSAKHIKSFGVGIRALLDIDLLIRSFDNFDENYFYSLCDKVNLKRTATVLLSLCNKWFLTPVKALIDFDDDENKELYDNLSVFFIEGGTFGFKRSTIGATYIKSTAKGNDNITFFVKLKSLLCFIFLKPSMYYSSYKYTDKHHFLVPVAFFHRIFKAVFSKKRTSLKTAKEIFKSEDVAKTQIQLMNELGLI